MKKILVLGAGLVAPPLVRYLLEEAGLDVTVADINAARAQELVGGHPAGRGVHLDADDESALSALIEAAEVVVSLLPPSFHPRVARACVHHKRHMVTSSYVSDEMRVLDEEAKEAGVLLLNEVGLDPGLDHMAAKRIIDHVQAAGGKVRGFWSYCGGLPDPKSITTPWSYKFSWSPRGAVVAARNPARYLERGDVVKIPAWDLFMVTRFLHVDTLGYLEAYPNRDSLPYIELYGLEGIEDMYRGTLRYPGHCDTWLALSRCGMLDVSERVGVADKSHAQFVAELCHGRPGRAREAFARKASIPVHCDSLHRLEWLGMFSDEKIGVEPSSPLDVLVRKLQEKLTYAPGERDMVVQVHEFAVTDADGSERRLSSRLLEYGDATGISAMSRTVGLPTAVATRLVCEERVSLRGVRIPVHAEIYDPILDALVHEGVEFSE